jgi:hypothetical protein
MTAAERQNPVETIAEWVAPIPLAVAVGWAGKQLGLSPAEFSAAGVAVLTVGFALMRRIGKRSSEPYGFEPAVFEPAEAGAEPGELLLDEKDAVLILDDPLVDAAPDSRVVKLFERQEPTPGELVERIADFLGDGRRPSESDSAGSDTVRVPDASAALHAALANIRASLR